MRPFLLLACLTASLMAGCAMQVGQVGHPRADSDATLAALGEGDPYSVTEAAWAGRLNADAGTDPQRPVELATEAGVLVVGRRFLGFARWDESAGTYRQDWRVPMGEVIDLHQRRDAFTQYIVLSTRSGRWVLQAADPQTGNASQRAFERVLRALEVARPAVSAAPPSAG